jgi:hypothetical protein
MSTLPLRADQPECADAIVATQTFWQRPFVQDILPFLTSLLLHLGVIVLGVLTYKAVVVMTTVSKTPPIIPDSLSTITDNNNKVLQFKGLAEDAFRPPTQDKFLDVAPTATGLSDQRANLQALARAGGGSGDSSDDAIALGLKDGFGKLGKGLGNGIGDGLGTGGGFGLAPFGIGGGGIFNAVPIGGHRVGKIVFLCDSSGSMMNKFDALRVELRKAVDRLQPVQQFDIIFFSEDRYIALDNQLQNALPETKRKAYDMVEKISPHSTSNPIPGIRAAFAANPEVIFMLTDGDFPNNQEVRDEIKKLSAGKKVIVNTIAFFDRGEDYEKLLKQIADDTRGTFRFVTEQELNP